MSDAELTPAAKRARTMAERAATRAATPPPTVASLKATLVKIDDRRGVIGLRVREVVAERAPLVLAGLDGNADARALAAALNVEHAALMHEITLLGEAEGEAQRLLRVALEAEAGVAAQAAEAERQAALASLLALVGVASEAAERAGREFAAVKAAARALYSHDQELADRLTRSVARAVEAALAQAGILRLANLPTPPNARQATFLKVLEPLLEGAKARPPQPPAKPRPEVSPEALHVVVEPPDHGAVLKRTFDEARAEAPEARAQPQREDADA